MTRYLTGIEKHLLKWHTRVFLDTMYEEATTSFNFRVIQTADAPFCRQFISVRGNWELCDEIKEWLAELGIEYILHLNSTVQPYEWSLAFSDKGHAALFKLRWSGV